MAHVTPEQVNAMAKLMAALDADHGTVIKSPKKTAPSSGSLADIMEAFSTATNEVVNNSANYPELQRAITTEATPDGARVGSWTIAARTEGGMGKFYNVSHALTGEPIATDLRLYEAALSLVNALNEGSTITSTKVKTILHIEEDYSHALTDAVQFSSRMKVTEGAQHDIAEARYSEAKRKALTAKRALSQVTKLF